MSPPSGKGSRPREFQGTAGASEGREGAPPTLGIARAGEPEPCTGTDRAWAARAEKLSGEGGGGDGEKEPETHSSSLSIE